MFRQWPTSSLPLPKWPGLANENLHPYSRCVETECYPLLVPAQKLYVYCGVKPWYNPHISVGLSIFITWFVCDTVIIDYPLNHTCKSIITCLLWTMNWYELLVMQLCTIQTHSAYSKSCICCVRCVFLIHINALCKYCSIYIGKSRHVRI